MAQRNQVGGFFGSHDPGQPGNAQHVAFFGGARFDQGQRGGLHADAAFGHSNAVRVLFGSHIHHVGLALCVKVGEGGCGGVG